MQGEVELETTDEDIATLEALSRSPEWRDVARVRADVPRLYGHTKSGEHKQRLLALRQSLLSVDAERYHLERDKIRQQGLRRHDLLHWLQSFPREQRDFALEGLLGIANRPLAPAALAPGLIDYVASGLEPIVSTVAQAPVQPEDVVVDIGAGLGKVLLLTHLLSGARGIGIELQPALVEEARRTTAELGLTDMIRYVEGDARTSDLAEGTVFFLYLPFFGAAVDAVMERLHEVAKDHPIVVCALAVDLQRYPWLSLRKPSSFWLSVYDSQVDAVAPRPYGPSPIPSSLLAELAPEPLL